MESPVAVKLAKDERRTAILEIAHAAFLADGYATTSMSTIAARVGGSKATLYNYFSSKEELFTAVIASKCEALQARLYDAEVRAGDFHSALQSFGERFLQLVLEKESIATYRLVLAECGRFPELGQAFYKVGVRQGRGRLGEFFTRAIDAGYLRDSEPITMADYFFDLCLSGIHTRKLWNVEPNPSADDIRINVSRAIAIFLAAFGGENAGHGDAAALCVRKAK